MNFSLRAACQVVAATVCLLPLSGHAAPSEATLNAINGARVEYQAARKAIDNEDWKAALEALKRAEKLDPHSAEIQNQIGFTLRQTGEFQLAVSHYLRALELDPHHRGAHEYMGRAYLHLGKPEKARELLAKLESLCTAKCAERDLLKRAIDEWDPWQRPMRVGRFY